MGASESSKDETAFKGHFVSLSLSLVVILYALDCSLGRWVIGTILHVTSNVYQFVFTPFRSGETLMKCALGGLNCTADPSWFVTKDGIEDDWKYWWKKSQTTKQQTGMYKTLKEYNIYHINWLVGFLPSTVWRVYTPQEMILLTSHLKSWTFAACFRGIER